jgi:hypothetical protein
VATAVYGDADAPEVQALRRFRDETLSRSSLGRTAIQAYWLIGPKLAAVVVKAPVLRPPLKWLIRQIAKRV